MSGPDDQGEFELFDAPNETGDAGANALPPPRRTLFTGWDRPLVDEAVAFLAADWESGILDLGNLLVVVPTRHAGRRLREALAMHTADRGAVTPPLVVTPEFLVSPALLPDSDRPVASDAEILGAWIAVLRDLRFRDFPRVFPAPPPEQSLRWALHTASRFIGLRKLLGEAGLLMADAAKKLAEEGIETHRWRELTALEERYLDRLVTLDRRDPQECRTHVASSAILDDAIERVVVLGMADPLPLALTTLQSLAATRPVEVLVYAPLDLRQAFDDWGIPLTEAWSARHIDLPDDLAFLHRAASPAEQAATAVDRLHLHEHADAPNAAAICVPDTAVAPPLRKALEATGRGAFEPAGRPLETHQTAWLLRTIADFVATGSMSAFSEFVRCPDFLRSMLASPGWDERDVPAPLLKFFDDLQADHLPDTIDDAGEMLKRSNKEKRGADKVMTAVVDWRRRLTEDSLDKALPEFLGAVYGHRRFNSDSPADKEFTDVANAVNGALDAMTSAAFKEVEKDLTNAERFEILLHLLRSEHLYTERGTRDIDLQGWLELFWEDAPHVILTGFNDGKVPESIVGDPFLPNTALTLLGLRDNDRWLARDAYYLTAILESRRGSGRVDIVLGHAAEDGSPLRPSRLLFHSPDEELPDRVRRIFHGGDGDMAVDPARMLSRSQTWALHPPALPQGSRLRLESGLGVTAFRSYLACPFRFYLSTGLGMTRAEVGKMEMNAAEFGNLCHDVLKKFGRDTALRESADPDELRAFFHREADAFVERRYGRSLTMPVLIQLESAKQRLSWAADIQAGLREDGWRIVEAEWAIHEQGDWAIAGVPIRGVIDRIDRHETSGATRVIDYKTSATGKTPEEAHLAAFKRTEDPETAPEWSRTVSPGGKPAHWTDLQLPLYALAVSDHFKEAESVECAFFNLPLAASLTALHPWPELDSALLDSAKSCAVGVLDAIKAGQFWPPAASVRFDDFEDLFFGDPVASVDETAFQEALKS